MKRIILHAVLFASFLVPGIMKAQYAILNGSFETWTSNTQPTDWKVVSGNILKWNGVQYTKQTVKGTDTTKTPVFRPAKDGQFCIQISNTSVGTTLIPGLIEDSFPFTGRPIYFSMNYAYFGLPNEQSLVSIFMSKWNSTTKRRDTVLSVLVGTPPGFTEPWVTFLNANLSTFYHGSLTPDSCRIGIISAHASPSTSTTSIYIDELFFQDEAPTGIEAPVTENFNATFIYPNPFTGTTNIRYNLSENGQVTLKVYDISGKEISTLVDGNQTIGTHDVVFDGTNLKGGVYFYRLQSGASVETGKLILNK